MPNLNEHVSLATAAGFDVAAKKTLDLADRQRRLTLAYEFYRFVKPEHVNNFQDKLKEKTFRHEGKHPNLYHVYDQLKFTPADNYQDMPPADVLEAVKTAKERGIFDSFEVGKIESAREYRDPIVFGRINGCGDRFYIAQWDDDVSIQDLIGDHEG